MFPGVGECALVCGALDEEDARRGAVTQHDATDGVAVVSLGKLRLEGVRKSVGGRREAYVHTGVVSSGKQVSVMAGALVWGSPVKWLGERVLGSCCTMNEELETADVPLIWSSEVQ